MNQDTISVSNFIPAHSYAENFPLRCEIEAKVPNCEHTNNM